MSYSGVIATSFPRGAGERDPGNEVGVIARNLSKSVMTATCLSC